MLNYILNRNKKSAATLLNLPVQAIAEVVEYANAYYVKVKKGFGRGTFVSKANLLAADRETVDLHYWMKNCNKKKIEKIQVGTYLKGCVKDFGKLCYTALELAVREYDLVPSETDDEVIIGEFQTNAWNQTTYKIVDSYSRQFA